MDERMKRYHESLKDMPAPIEACEIRQKLDTRGLIAYAKKHATANLMKSSGVLRPSQNVQWLW